jgi:hypothetical protein
MSSKYYYCHLHAAVSLSIQMAAANVDSTIGKKVCHHNTGVCVTSTGIAKILDTEARIAEIFTVCSVMPVMTNRTGILNTHCCEYPQFHRLLKSAVSQATEHGTIGQ